jgi:hypothetical protein
MNTLVEASDVVIYTSLAPNLCRTAEGNEISEGYQRACIKSWKRLGANIVSLNPVTEISLLRDLKFEVDFLRVDAKRPRIVDFINAARNSEKKISAIVNADCLLVAPQAVIDSSLEYSMNGMVLFERLNIHPETNCPTGTHCNGFDLFLFSTKPLFNTELDERFAIGSPWWDYYFPMAYEAAGGKLYTLPGPALIHLDHPIGFSQTTYNENRQVVYSFIRKGQFVVSNFNPDPGGSEPNLTALGAACFEKLQSSEKVKIEDEVSVLALRLLRNIETTGNIRLSETVRRIQSLSLLRILRRIWKQKSSLLLAALGAPFSRRFADRMRRRAAKSILLLEITT